MTEMRPNTKAKRAREEYRAARDENVDALPKKKFYRQRAHANPFSDHALTYPICPAAMDWSNYYSACKTELKKVEIADIGCGFGGLLFALAPRFADKLILGLEIRTSVAEFVQEKVRAMRQQSLSTEKPDAYQNLACVRANTMKFMPNFFEKGQLGKIFLCFPDPHFKARKHKARIVSATLAPEYAFIMRPGGVVYTITDVKDLHEWMIGHFASCELFQMLTDEEIGADECVSIMSTATEEGKKVERNNGPKLIACFRRLEDPPWPE